MNRSYSVPTVSVTGAVYAPSNVRFEGGLRLLAGSGVAAFVVGLQRRSERRLREWQAQGMTELFIPLPGTRNLMVCPLETALRRESGACRQLEPDSPELEAIGDAREVISVHQIYRQGEIVWRGPGAYR